MGGPPPVAVLREIDESRSEAVDVRIEECSYNADELDAEVRRLAMSAREQGLRFWSIGPNAAASGIELWSRPQDFQVQGWQTSRATNH